MGGREAGREEGLEGGGGGTAAAVGGRGQVEEATLAHRECGACRAHLAHVAAQRHVLITGLAFRGGISGPLRCIFLPANTREEVQRGGRSVCTRCQAKEIVDGGTTSACTQLCVVENEQRSSSVSSPLQPTSSIQIGPACPASDAGFQLPPAGRPPPSPNLI